MAQQRVGLRPPHADRPCTARHLQQYRRLAVAGQVATPPDIGGVDARVRTVLDGVRLLDVAAADQFVWPHADLRAASCGLRLGGDCLVVVTQRLAQRLLEILLRRHVAALDQQQQRPRNDGEHQSDSATGTAEVATQTTAHSVEYRPGEIHHRHLAGRPAEREHRQGDVALTGDRSHTVRGVQQLRCRAQQWKVPTHGRRGPGARGARSCR